MNSPLRVVARILVALSPLVFVVINLNPYVVPFLPAPSIESYLLWKTPLGTSQQAVMDYMRTTEALQPVARVLPPSHGQRVDFVMASPGPFGDTAVPGSYVFGLDGRLVGIEIRKSGDAR